MPAMKTGQSLAVRLSLITFLLTIAVVAVVGGAVAWKTYHNELQRIEVSINDLKQTHLPFIARAAWEFSEERLRLGVDDLGHRPHVSSVRLVYDGPTLEVGDAEASDLRMVSYPIEYQGQELGRLDIGFDVGALAAEARWHGWTMLGIATLPCLLLAITVLLVVRRLVTRPLADLSARTRSLGIDDLDQDFAWQGADVRHDELGQLFLALNTMRQNLREQIDQRVAAEQKLAVSEEKYREVFNGIGEAAFIHDPSDGSILDCNQTACEVYGWSREEILQLTVADLSEPSPGFGMSDAVRQIARAMEQGAAVFEWRARKRDGTVFWVEVNLRACKIGAEQRLLATVRNITERREAAEQIRQMQKMDAIGQMTGGLAHDFNNLLAAIIGGIELLQMQCSEGSEQMDMLEVMLSASTQAADLTAKMLAFARKQTYQRHPFDLHDLIGDTLVLFERSLDRDIQIERALSADPRIVLADRTAIQNAILNCCLNAKDAMVDGGQLLIESSNVTLNEETCQRAPHDIRPGSYLLIRIVDQGSGMEEEVKERIFEPFFTTKPMGRGTGMGMAAVFGIVGEHDGTIMIESTLGAGTTVNIYLPLAKDQSNARAATPQRIIRGSGAILLVDDEDVVRETTCALLEKAGYTVTAVASGDDALDRLQHGVFQLIVLDMMMPGMNGEQCYRRLRADGVTTPVLFLSGYAEDLAADDILTQPGVAFLRKPVTLPILSLIVHELCIAGADAPPADKDPHTD